MELNGDPQYPEGAGPTHYEKCLRGAVWAAANVSTRVHLWKATLPKSTSDDRYKDWPFGPNTELLW